MENEEKDVIEETIEDKAIEIPTDTSTTEEESKDETIEETKEKTKEEEKVKEKKDEPSKEEEKIDLEEIEKKHKIEINTVIRDSLLENKGLSKIKEKIQIFETDTKKDIIKRIDDFEKEVKEISALFSKNVIPDTNLEDKKKSTAKPESFFDRFLNLRNSK